MKYLVFALALLSVILAAQQPEPLIQKDIKIQPIVENLEMGEQYWYVQTIKVYYKDTLLNKFKLRMGPELDSYCTDNTILTFHSYSDSLKIKSIHKMSCEILAIFNLTSYQINWLSKNIVNKVTIYNTERETMYVVEIKNKEYFKNVFLKYSPQ